MSDEDLSLPDTSLWQPRDKASDTLSRAFMLRCASIEEAISFRARHERELNIDNFDSGPGTEDIIRAEMAKLLPNRYSVRAGVLNDSYGNTGGDFDLVIFNSDWVPEIKAGAAENSRRIHFPIEGVYAVGEIKQTLTESTLDQALEKLVVAHRLHRPPTFANRIVENRDLDSCPHGLTNPLYSFIIATRLGDGLNLDTIVKRFVEINQQLRRLEIVRCVCVLGEGTFHWVHIDEHDEIIPPLFMGHDLHETLNIALEPSSSDNSAFYAFVRNLMLNLYHMVLAPEDIAAKYGPAKNNIKVAKSDELSHSTYARPNNSPSLPYDMEIDFLGTGQVDRMLGAHRDIQSDADEDG